MSYTNFQRAWRDAVRACTSNLRVSSENRFNVGPQGDGW
jgi:hypothetical protein